MTNIKNQSMQFLFADRELILMVGDLLSASVDAIVNPANDSLNHADGIAGQVVQQGGEVIQRESELFIKEHGVLESGMVALTSAGILPFEAIIHAVAPKEGEGDEQHKIQQAVSRSLQLCDMHNWKSIAFPVISAGTSSLSIEVSAAAIFRAVTSFWDARAECSPEKVLVCLAENNFQRFFDAFREASRLSDSEPLSIKSAVSVAEGDRSEAATGVIDLTEQDISDLSNDELNSWFK